MIEVKNLSKQFDHFTAVDQLSFTVKPGEVLGFLGPNGAGKSTTMKMITGFITPTDGTINVCGYDIQNDAIAAKRLIGYLPEGAPCYEDMTPLQFLDFIAEIRGFSGAEANKRIADVIHKLELKSVLHQRIQTLSKGFKRRVGIAQAIIHDPTVLILDEPTDGLDPNQKHQIRELIRNLSEDKIVIISTHILEEVSAVCTRAMIISNGKLLVDKTPDDLETMSHYHGAVTVEFGTAADFYDKLSKLPGLAAIDKKDEDNTSFTLFPQPDTSLLDSVNECISKNQWPVKQLYIEKGRLDDVFRKVTEEETV